MADGPKLTIAGKLFVVLFIAGCFAGAWFLFRAKQTTTDGDGSGGSSSTSSTTTSSAVPEGGTAFGIAYGTEKKRWLEWAQERFKSTPQGAKIRIELIPMGSLESAQSILAGNKKIHVWSPASALYKDVFVQEWQVKHGGDPIGKQEALALTPMVFVSWDSRYQGFVQKYGKMTFETIG